eukprot:3939645-Rhodomonas_salina.2
MDPVVLRVGTANFEVRWEDLEPDLQNRLKNRLDSGDVELTAKKLLRSVLRVAVDPVKLRIANALSDGSH